MSGVVTVVAITWFPAFAAGLGAGIAMVFAASVRRAGKAYCRNRQVNDGPPWHSGDWPDDNEPDGPPRWPTQGGY